MVAASMSNAQPIPGGEYFIQNCKCISYDVVFPNTKIQRTYFTDSTGRVKYSTEIEIGVYYFVDSFYYDKKDRLKIKKSYSLYDGEYKLKGVEEYKYSEFGKITQINTRSSSTDIVQTQNYVYDSKNRPYFFTVLYQDDSLREKYEIKFDFVNDTIAILKYSASKLKITGKRIYNKKGDILKEFIQNVKQDKKVNFDFKYDSKGRLSKIQKTKVIGGDLSLFDLEHYLQLADMNRKIEFIYDTKGRIATHNYYMNIKLDKVIKIEFKYKDI